ncbi:universal stress protein [Streptomyces roseus]|uniref:universal stress protein n=1 Tax=Streptomyces roseus TaxID=66430 RepID=UPI0037F16656
MTVQVTAGLDGSREGFAAVAWAAREAVLREVPLHLIHVEERHLTPAMPYPIAAFEAERSTGLLRATADRLRRDHAGLVVTTERTRGRAGPLLSAAADEGSGEILVGADLNHPSGSVLAFAFQEAARRGATIRVVHGWALPGPSLYAMVADPGIGETVGVQVASALAELVRPLRKTYRDVQVIEEAVVGAAGAHLLEASKGAELVVVGRRRHPAPLGPRIGHIAHAVIHHVAAPVAVVPFG